MAIVLQSPLIGMDANDLGRLRLSVGENSLWSGLRPFVEASQNAGWIRFVDSMDTWRTMSRRQGITDLIWHIVRHLACGRIRERHAKWLGASWQCAGLV